MANRNNVPVVRIASPSKYAPGGCRHDDIAEFIVPLHRLLLGAFSSSSFRFNVCYIQGGEVVKLQRMVVIPLYYSILQ